MYYLRDSQAEGMYFITLTCYKYFVEIKKIQTEKYFQFSIWKDSLRSSQSFTFLRLCGTSVQLYQKALTITRQITLLEREANMSS